MLPFELTKTPHTSPFRASYGVSFMSTSTEIDRVIKGFYCTNILIQENVQENVVCKISFMLSRPPNVNFCGGETRILWDN